MSTAVLSVPPLREGERLSREEFERRYEPMHDVKAELLDGLVYMSSPVTRAHSTPHSIFVWWIVSYAIKTPGVESGDNGSVRLAPRSMPQPDVSLRILETHGGGSHTDEDDYVAGVPELFGEVAQSSLTYDRTVKMPIYRREGVREFILWRVEDEAIDWYVLRDGDYVELPVGADGIVRSETFPGLWLDVAALARRDGGSVELALHRGLASAEHAEFVTELQRRSQS